MVPRIVSIIGERGSRGNISNASPAATQPSFSSLVRGATVLPILLALRQIVTTVFPLHLAMASHRRSNNLRKPYQN
jgi:hypothetical protein